MPEAAMDDDGALQCLISSKAGDIDDFDILSFIIGSDGYRETYCRRRNIPNPVIGTQTGQKHCNCSNDDGSLMKRKKTQ